MCWTRCVFVNSRRIIPTPTAMYCCCCVMLLLLMLVACLCLAIPVPWYVIGTWIKSVSITPADMNECLYATRMDCVQPASTKGKWLCAKLQCFFFLFHHDRQFRFLFAFSSDFMSIAWITFGIVNLVFICSQNRV